MSMFYKLVQVLHILKSDHIGIEIVLSVEMMYQIELLKSDHIGIEI